MDMQAALLAEIDVFLKELSIAETTFGRRAVNDGKFVKRMRGGGGIQTRTVERVQAFMAAARVKAGRARPSSRSSG